MPMSLSRVALALDELVLVRPDLRDCASAFRGTSWDRKSPNQAMRTMRKPSEPMLETLSAMYRFMPWIRAVTAIRVVVARMMPSSVRKLRSLFLRRESRAMRAASQKEALRRNWRVLSTIWVCQKDARRGRFVPLPNYLDGKRWQTLTSGGTIHLATAGETKIGCVCPDG